MESVAEDVSHVCGEGSSGEQKKGKLKGKGTAAVQGDDNGDLIGSSASLKLKAKCDSKKPVTQRTKAKSARTPELLALWTSVVNEWKNREQVPFHFRRTAKKYGINLTTVSLIIKRFKERGEVKFCQRGGRKRTDTSESWQKLRVILEQEPNISGAELAKRLDLGETVGRRMLREYRNGARDIKAERSKEFQGTTAAAEEGDNGNDNGCDWERDDDDLQGNVDRAPCFICDAVCKSFLDSTFPSGGLTTSMPLEVERGVGVIFFLRDVLGMRDDNLENVMKEARGKNPDAWEISVCTDPGCGGAVERSFALWKEIKKLEGELKKCKKGILERIRSRCSTEMGVSEDDQALLNARVRERVKRGVTETDSMTLEEDPGEPQVKIEPQDEEFNDLDDFTAFGDPCNDNDNECDLKDVKLEADDNGLRCRRSSRRKRKTDKFKYEKLGSGANSRAGLGTEPKGKSKLKGTKLGKEDETAVRFGEKMYSCQSCPALEEMDKDKFIAHLAFHSSYPNKCTECDNHFPEGVDNDQIQKHWEERHPGSESDSPKVVQVSAAVVAGKIWACSGRKCSELFGSAQERDGHELLVHGMPEPKAKFRCSTCSSQFRDMTELRFHRAIEHPQDAMLSCCYCSIQLEINSGKEGIKFLNMDQLKKHISQKHPERVNVNAQGEPTRNMRFLQTCPICGLVFSFINYSKLDYHISRDHGHKLHETYTCPVCSRKMRYADAWDHTKLRHWPDSPARFPCRFCGKVFRRTFNRQQHEQIHKNKDTRPFQCELCGSSFAVRQYLKLHRRVSHERRPFPSALKKKQSRNNVEVPSKSGETTKVTPSVVEPGPSESFAVPPAAWPHQEFY